MGRPSRRTSKPPLMRGSFLRWLYNATSSRRDWAQYRRPATLSPVPSVVTVDIAMLHYSECSHVYQASDRGLEGPNTNGLVLFPSPHLEIDV
jgi:hypothetical protein